MKTERGNYMKDNIDIYFNSKAHKYVFALVYTDKELREKLLGITEKLYLDKNKAKAWRNDIIKEIHPDKCKLEEAPLANSKLTELYSHMTEQE